jgi:hypothetical protein
MFDKADRREKPSTDYALTPAVLEHIKKNKIEFEEEPRTKKEPAT